MKGLFQYNWDVRHAWFKWCLNQPQEELVKKRSGGMGSIMKNLFHIVDVETSWIYAILEKPDIQPDYSHYQTIQQIVQFSDVHRSEIESVVFNYSSAFEHLPVKAAWSVETYTQGDILRHLIAHEIHHIGQISVWARESGSAPVSASYVGRKV
ncbi:DinB family protein [Bacillus haynesii]|uniref:DinB family protein n=1 Tax=Bacillus haynesii TaxID=1925021 RepID=A0AA90F0H6_9BACI|nr:DinB family protein [Bacillus haynesii]MCY7772239.1 DinB family protein [Bacillus haynesii]MCY7791237.1 DinB family protein [Bacillus haynesii]MCY7850968.1 DinB family protein [Bacillus haynesii]MCY8010141.1 DinB family protein [Bacillus haynesii]MCY8014786.1 DinB family protein [Bacillus haynesii]